MIQATIRSTTAITSILCRSGTLALLAGVTIASGCQQMATYPPVETTAKLQRPAAEPVPTIIAQTVKYLRERHLDGRELPINLPQEMPATAYDKVFAHLGSGQPMREPGEHAIHFTEIRTRSMNAQVDVLFPTSTGFHQFMTVTLERGVLQNWHVKSERKWIVRNNTPPGPNYMPPPIETESETATAHVNPSY